MEFTEPVEWINKPCTGYMVNARFSSNAINQLSPILDHINRTFGETVHVMPVESLHITLLDWIAPLVDYDGQDKDGLFAKLFEEYDSAMRRATADRLPIEVNFNEIHVSPSTIYVQGRDNGVFDTIRNDFTSSVELLPGTKMPPKIIHTSLARFTGIVGLGDVTQSLADMNVAFTERISEFRLIHSKREPLADYEVMKTYPE